VNFQLTTVNNAPYQWLLVHGAMDRATSMGRLTRHLTSADVIAFDRRGYAGSREKNPPASPEDVFAPRHLDDIRAFCDRKPTFIFGHSMGGTYALLLAAQGHPNLLGVLTYESPLPAEPWWPHWAARPGDLDEPPHEETLGDRAEAFMVAMIGADRWRRLPEQTRTARRQEGFTLIYEMAYLRTSAGTIDYDKITVPVLAAIGQLAPERHQRALPFLSEKIADCRTVAIRDANHGIHLSQPKTIAQLLEEFARSVLHHTE
jgi:pimeloyl-ACP methyl ester carboxylesterase